MSRGRTRVAVVLHEPEYGGATQALLRVVPLLEAAGWRFTYWVPGEGAAATELRKRGYEVAVAERDLRFSLASLREPPGVARRIARTPGYVARWRRWAASQDADLLHANSVLSLPEVLSRPRGGPPTLLYVHEILPPGPRGWSAARLVRAAGTVVTVSQAAAEPLRRGGSAPLIVHPGTPIAALSPTKNGEGRLVVGAMGTICKRKGSELFVAAARDVRRARPDVEFRMAGNLVVGAERRWAQELVSAAGREGIAHASWVDGLDELSRWDILVLAARSDPFPLVVLEAMALGKAIVATRVGGIPEQLGDGAGLLVEPEDVGGIAAAVARLADDPRLRADLGAAARRRVEDNFTVELQAEGLERAYRSALAR